MEQDECAIDKLPAKLAAGDFGASCCLALSLSDAID